MKKIIVPIILLFICSPALGATYYVAETEQGTGGGLTATNADSVATLNTGAAPYDDLVGDTLYLLGTTTTEIVLPTGGSAAGVLTIRGDYPGDPAIISNVAAYGITATNRSYVTFKPCFCRRHKWACLGAGSNQ